ncbi:molybdopterin cofactor-binding domain-containing protein [Sporichthya sp.]|uniref:molybdopterin cofactor-binding domain-containing protein n=1 Tax=Sporichthya sp. TaxID=65475 RepID=UPI0017CDA1BC|nr:molybdopterin cofactor-binding domain-containing protein [Sporichthya sp.]MBA3745735.1 molybdopterin-dependent oxidoreductase [Sporichthya sp.]
MSPTPNPDSAAVAESTVEQPTGTSRRQFVGYVLAGTTLAATADLAWESAAPSAAYAAGATPIPSNATFSDEYDFLDLYRDSCLPTNHLLAVEISPDGKASFGVPRQDSGQGILTSFAQIIADELDMPIEDVHTFNADARPELVYNQLTGGSTSHFSLWQPVKMAAATARTALATAAAEKWNVPVSAVTTRDGAVFGPDGQMATYGSLTELAASKVTRPLDVKLKSKPGKYVGQSIGRMDAHDMVTGKKQFTMDLAVPNALPTMICRPPTIHGTVQSVENLEQVKAMPGVTDVGAISTGVAVRARTFGQCVDAIRALRVSWGAGTIDEENSDSLTEKVTSVLLPIAPASPADEVIEEDYVFHYRSGSPMETNNSIADVRGDSAEVWGSNNMPIITLQRIALLLDIPEDKVTVHCPPGGGSFGRKLFQDASYEAVEASKLFGKPVRLMWHRTDDARHGRMHPMMVNRVRATKQGNSITSFTMTSASSACDWTHGLGEIISGSATAQDPRLGFSGNKELGNLSVSMGFYQLVTGIPYNFGATAVYLNEIFAYDTLPTSAVRNVYSPDTGTASELHASRLADSMGMDDYEFRRAFAKDDGWRAVLDKVAEAGNWGRTMPEGTAQSIALHSEYQSKVACLMEIDARPAMTNRKIREAYTGPRITKAIMAIDIGKAINPRNVQANLMGGCMDGIAQALSASNHIVDGLPQEGSWDNYRYTRQWNVPFLFECFVMPDNREIGGGAGETGVAVSQAAAAIAWGRAKGTLPTENPVNFRDPLGYVVKSRVPPIPQSPINGRRFAR